MYKRVPITNKTTTQMVGGEKLREDADELAERQESLALDRAAHEVKVANEKASAYRSEAMAQEQAAGEIKQVQQEGNAEAAAAMERSKDLTAKAGKLEAKGRSFWGDKDAGFKITALIGSMFGGALAGSQGGPNRFMDGIDRMIAREDKQHQDKIDGLRKDAKSEVTFHDLALTRTKDRVEQSLMARDMALQSVGSSLQARLADLGDSEAAVGVGEALAAVEQKRIDTQAQLADRQQVNQSQKVIKLHSGGAGGGQAVGPDGKPIKPIPGTNISDAGAYAGLSNTERQVARKASGAANALYNTLSKMGDLRGEHGAEMEGTKAATEYANLAQSAKVSLSQMMDQGTITANDAEQMKDLWEEDIGWKASDLQRLGGNDPTLNKINGAMKNVEAQANNRLRAYGLKLEGLKSPNKRIAGTEGGW